MNKRVCYGCEWYEYEYQYWITIISGSNMIVEGIIIIVEYSFSQLLSLYTIHLVMYDIDMDFYWNFDLFHNPRWHLLKI